MPPLRITGLLAAVLEGLVATGAVHATEVHAQARWRLSAQPTVVIGSVDGPSWETFHDIRGVVSTSDGTIVVADGGSLAEVMVLTILKGLTRREAAERLGITVEAMEKRITRAYRSLKGDDLRDRRRSFGIGSMGG